MEKLCKCGNKLHRKHNSTIYPKQCPNCQYRALFVGSSSKSLKIGTTPKNPATKKFDFYKTTAWKWCRKYVLLYYADKNGVTRCATSGRYLVLGTKDCHCGHFIKVKDGNSTNYATALLFENLAPQSLQDNTYQGGREGLMREWLVKQHGEDKIKELEAKRRVPCKLDEYTLQQIAAEYKAKYKLLLKGREMRDPWAKK